MIKVTTKEELDDGIIIDKALIGSSVFAKNGEKIGSVKDFYIDPTNFQIKALTVHKGPFKFEHLIECSYIESLGPGGVILNITPIEDLIKKTVVDSNGFEIGKVQSINKEEQTNKMISLMVSPGLGKDNIIIKPDDICSIGTTVILCKPSDDLDVDN